MGDPFGYRTKPGGLCFFIRLNAESPAAFACGAFCIWLRGPDCMETCKF